jgi:hypothetical protein
VPASHDGTHGAPEYTPARNSSRVQYQAQLINPLLEWASAGESNSVADCKSFFYQFPVTKETGRMRCADY